ncbi:hypothetical protein QTP88_002624 [Uroleucon formosanum]
MVVPYDQRGLWFCGEYRSEPWDSINPYIIKLTCCRDIVSKKKYIDLKLDILRLLQLGVVDVRTAAVLRYNVTAENSVRYLEEASCVMNILINVLNQPSGILFNKGDQVSKS